MSQAFRFPTLNKVEQHQSLQERLDAAQRVGWQSGFENGLEQGRLEKQAALEQQIEARVDALLQERLELEKKQFIDNFNIILDKANSELSQLSASLKTDITLIITRLAEFVIDTELQTKPEIRLELVEKAIKLLADRDLITKIIFSSLDKEWLNAESLKSFSIAVSFDDKLASGDIELVAERQTHSFSFSQRLQSLLDEITPVILKDTHEQ
ncbi:FliH/SctL family protein [Pseudoalteromonas sp. JB197]|uniref:FliH/SctL family protein n=1 Tax=Pseudoalteromonas sp. JB197 TaxID=1434839 RepID=UPI00097EC109|nr:FliH/SctL family protein [Pseudoalteromonas sp. JB197]PCC12275.1 flagellar assembly protein FliH [Pseudoalteromonas sp. JB197]SJN48921.1 hypothetical protein CZ797_17095 [Pseudoalteromonas sp. JB197]